MSFFSGITSALSGITGAIGSVIDPISSLVTGGASLLGGLATNSANASIARQQEAFQADMSGTAYQRSVKDLEAAGLSPMLAYSQGGATTPSGANIAMQNPVAPAVSSALQAEQLKTTQSQSMLNTAAAVKATADAKLSTAQAAKTQADTILSTSDVPAAKNAAAMAQTWWGRNIAPLLPSLLQSTHSAGSIANIFK